MVDPSQGVRDCLVRREKMDTTLKRIVESALHVRVLPMRLCRTSRLPGLNVSFLQRTIVWLLGLGAFACGGQAQPVTTITSLAQLAESLGRADRLVANLSLRATVFSCSTNTGALILQDRSGPCLLEMNRPVEHLEPGDEVEITCESAVLSPGLMGIHLAPPSLLDNDGIHASRTLSRDIRLKAGRYAVHLDWFNDLLGAELSLSCVATNLRDPAGVNTMVETNLIHGLRAHVFHGSWSRLPNFQMLQPVKVESVREFDVGLRTRQEKVGIRFEGYLEAPRSGSYLFTLQSDDGSRLWIGPANVSVIRTGKGTPPAAPQAGIGEEMPGPGEVRLATIEGRVSFVARAGKGLRLEMRSGQSSASVAITDAGLFDPMDLLNARVRVSGVAGSVLEESRKSTLGTLQVAGPRELAIIEPPPGRGTLPPVLKSVIQVHNLTTETAARKIPVDIQGTITAVAPLFHRWVAIQDETRGTFVRLDSVSDCDPKVGELWNIVGHVQPGDFAPVVVAEKGTFLGKGRLPEPAHPTSSQLSNGSMDVQWVELHGIVIDVQGNVLGLLLPEGRLEITMQEREQAELKKFENAVVRIRGTLFSVWDPETHEVRFGSIAIHNPSISVEHPAPGDPFDAPEKTPRGLFRFDAKATPLQRVKVRGQVTHVDSRRVFMEQGAGIEVYSRTDVDLKAGDIAEAVGYPGISGAGPQLREAFLRKIGVDALPKAPEVSDTEFPVDKLASTRLRIRGTLVGRHTEADKLVLQIQSSKHLFLAYVSSAEELKALRAGSKLLLTGIYVSGKPDGLSPAEAPHFELRVNAPGDVVVLSSPLWWTLPRLLSAVGVLLVTLALAAIWIALLRRQVAQRTSQLQVEIREREEVERQHAVEAERSRIARDLHDDLGSRLTEINFLSSTSGWPCSADDTYKTFTAIGERARELVKALDVIVWAVDPEDNSLQSLADYLSGYTREFLANTSIVCRFKIPIAFPATTLNGQIRHEVLMVVKETLNNIVRHADATEVKFQMSVDDRLEICIADDGRGFDPEVDAEGHGLRNCSVRLAKIGGSCEIEPVAGRGTTVRIQIPLPALSGVRAEEKTTGG
jgi:signal transduction histidine kinase